MGNGPPFCRVFAGILLEPMPIIGVRRAIMQCRGHDDDRAAPALAVGPGISPPTPRTSRFFGGGGWGVAGFVDSWPKTLVPSASNRSTPPVDSRGLQWTPAMGDSTRSDFAVAPQAVLALSSSS